MVLTSSEAKAPGRYMVLGVEGPICSHTGTPAAPSSPEVPSSVVSGSLNSKVPNALNSEVPDCKPLDDSIHIVPPSTLSTASTSSSGDGVRIDGATLKAVKRVTASAVVGAPVVDGTLSVVKRDSAIANPSGMFQFVTMIAM